MKMDDPLGTYLSNIGGRVRELEGKVGRLTVHTQKLEVRLNEAQKEFDLRGAKARPIFELADIIAAHIKTMGMVGRIAAWTTTLIVAFSGIVYLLNAF